MLRKNIAFLFLLALTPLLVAADTPVKIHPTPVQIDSRPEMAEIWIDGKFVGSAPLNYRLMPGDHKIELIRPRYATWTRTLTVVPETPTRVAALLEESNQKPCQ